MSLPFASALTLPRPAFDRADTAVSQGAIPGAWLATAAISNLAAVALLMAYAHLSIDPRAPITLAFAAVLALATGVRYAMRAPDNAAQRVARDAAESFGLFLLIALLGAIATYPLTVGTHGFADAGLERIDRLLRFDWVFWYELVAGHRALQILGTIAYQSIFATPAILLAVFAWEGRRGEARRFIASFWIAAMLSLALFRLMPAVGPLAFLWHGPIPYMPESALYQADLIPLLRDHAVHQIDLGALRGLVSAPSFHTVSAILYIAAAWPVTKLRRPVTIINVAMLVSTPIEGTHYLADMIAGAMVALTALAIVGAIDRVRLRRV